MEIMDKMRGVRSASPLGTFASFLGAAVILIPALGCDRQGRSAAESLPWNASVASARAPVPATGEASAAGASEPESADARERQFRDRLVQEHADGLRRIAADPVVVSAVIAANGDNLQTQEEIERVDAQWRATQGVEEPLIDKYLNNPCADQLRQEQRAHAEYVELFVMDDKGCIVAESNKTSDYWQGDEPKWLQSYHGGKGRMFADEIEYDESTRAYVVQISLPVFDSQGATIGAITASITSPQQD